MAIPFFKTDPFKNYDVTCHITFMESDGHLIPWHVVFAETEPPFLTHTIALDTKYLHCSYRDMENNLTYVNQFPRRLEKTKWDTFVIGSEMDEKVTELGNRLTASEGFQINIGATDRNTYIYLKEQNLNVVLIEKDLPCQSEMIAIHAAKDKYNGDGSWRA